MSTTYEDPQFDAAPDDTPPTLDTRHPSTLGRVRNRAKAVDREYVHGISRDHMGAWTYPGTIHRVDGIGPKAKPPTYGRPVFDEDEQTSSARMLGGVMVFVAAVVVGLAIWAFVTATGHALDAPAHLLPR